MVLLQLIDKFLLIKLRMDLFIFRKPPADQMLHNADQEAGQHAGKQQGRKVVENAEVGYDKSRRGELSDVVRDAACHADACDAEQTGSFEQAHNGKAEKTARKTVENGKDAAEQQTGQQNAQDIDLQRFFCAESVQSQKDDDIGQSQLHAGCGHGQRNQKFDIGKNERQSGERRRSGHTRGFGVCFAVRIMIHMASPCRKSVGKRVHIAVSVCAAQCDEDAVGETDDGLVCAADAALLNADLIGTGGGGHADCAVSDLDYVSGMARVVRVGLLDFNRLILIQVVGAVELAVYGDRDGLSAPACRSHQEEAAETQEDQEKT